MSLHDACHSIDSSDVRPILEIVKFPNSSQAENRHDPPLNLLPNRAAGGPGRRRGGAATRGDGTATGRCKKGQSSQSVDGWSGGRRAGGGCLVWLGLLDRRP